MIKKILLIILLAGGATLAWYFYLLNQNNTTRSPFVREGSIVPKFGSDESDSSVVDLTTLHPVQIEVTEKYQNNTFNTPRTVNLPEGFKINIFAAGMNAPRSLDTDDAGNIYVTDKGTGEVLLFVDNDKDNVADEEIVIDTGLRNIHGIDWYNNNLYVGEEHQILVYNNIRADGQYDSKEVLVAGLPSGAGHNTRTVKVGSDNKLYVSVGSSCNVCDETDERRAAIVTYNLDGSGEEIFARGLRNTVGFTFISDKLWGVDNGRDLIGDNIPPEELNLIEKGKHYGWPYCHGQGVVSPEYPDHVSFCENETAFPVVEMTAHSAPLGITPLPLGSDWTTGEHVLIAYHGSWNRTVPTGYKLVLVDISTEPKVVGDFATGWLQNNGEAWGRPVDVKFIDGNTLLVTDDRAGVIYAIERSE